MTDETTPKRAREDAPSAPTPEVDGSLPPRRSAEAWLKNALTSLPSELKTVLVAPMTECLKAFARLHEKTNANKKLAAEDAPLPRSIRFKFELTASKRTAEDPKFGELQVEASEIIDDAQKRLFRLIKKTSSMELLKLKQEYGDLITKTFLRMGKACLIYQKAEVSDQNEADIFGHILTTKPFIDVVPHDYTNQRKEFMQTEFRKWTDKTPMDIEDLDELSTDERAVIAMVRDYGEQLIQKPAEVLVSQVKRHQTIASLQAVFTEHDTESATADAMEVLDSETPATPETVRRIASEEVKKALDRDAAKQAKKDKRGAKSGASSKKKTKPAAESNRNGKADASNNAGKSGNDDKPSKKNKKTTKRGDKQGSNKKKVSFAKSSKKS